MAPSQDDAPKKTSSVYVQPVRVDALNKAAIRVSYETGRSRQISPSDMCRYLIDNFLEQAIQKQIDDAKR